jgi:hypothetical protein
MRQARGRDVHMQMEKRSVADADAGRKIAECKWA